MQKTRRKQRLRQPSSSFADCAEMSTDENIGKDFGTLMNAPLSKGGHFVFKSEKDWSIDLSQYSEFFTLDLKTLSAAIDCIPFNKYIDVDQRYFVSDQLTSINNNAERGKATYKTILNDLYMLNSLDAICSENETTVNTSAGQLRNLKLETNAKCQSEDSIDNLEEDIDFLLSLKEPVQSSQMTIMSTPILHNNDTKTKPKNISSKPIDLEKWLDTVLDD